MLAASRGAAAEPVFQDERLWAREPRELCDVVTTITLHLCAASVVVHLTDDDGTRRRLFGVLRDELERAAAEHAGRRDVGLLRSADPGRRPAAGQGDAHRRHPAARRHVPLLATSTSTTPAPPPATCRAVAERRAALVVIVCHFVASFAALGLPPFFTDLLPGLGDPGARWAGVLYVVPTACVAISAPLWGRLADRYGRKRLLLRAQLGLAVSFWLASQAQTVAQFAAVLVLQGLLGRDVLRVARLPRERVARAAPGRRAHRHAVQRPCSAGRGARHRRRSRHSRRSPGAVWLARRPPAARRAARGPASGTDPR